MKKFGRILSLVMVVAVCVAALWLLYHELRNLRLQDIRRSLAQIPTWRLWAAVGIAAANYILLIGYDWLAVRATGRKLSLARTALASFAGHVTSYNFGALLGGSTIRYRLYSAWGFTAVDIIQIVVMMAITFWIGIFALSGLVFVITPLTLPESLTLPDPESLHLPLPFRTTRPLGILLLVSTAIYLSISAWRRQPIRFWDGEIRLPDLTTTLLQICVAAADSLVVTACLHMLLGDAISLNYWQFLSVMLLAMVATVLSHVPGGVGVFELVVIKACGAETTPAVIAALLAYRFIYYLLPLAIVTVLLAGNELLQQRAVVTRWWRAVSPWSTAIAPQLLAAATFVGGSMLLLSGATPILRTRLQTVELSFPLPVVEISHFVGSLAGAGMLLLGIGMQRRLDSAWWMAVILTTVGIVSSVLKGFGIEEAAFLCLILAVLLVSRKEFYRRGSLLHSRFTPGWFTAILLAIGCSIWLDLFAHKHVAYSADLWWKFTFRGDAPRSLRGSVAAIVVLGLFAIRKLIRPTHIHPAQHSTEDIDVAEAIVSKSQSTSASLALLGDKHFLFNDERSGFVMFGVRGRSWVAMGDPVAEPAARGELVWSFRELVDCYDGWPVFYQVAEENLPLYLDQGLRLLKIGEEARVPLSDFSLDGSVRKGLRKTHHRVHNGPCTFEVARREQVPELLPALRGISDAWLAEKHLTEKGFSLGFFNESYLQRLPCAIVRHEQQPIAFANILCGGEGLELSVDLMRYLPGSPAGVMEFLFIELMLWGKREGFRWFNLGMAPLSGIPDRPLAPIWNRAAGLAFQFGDHFYHFEGVRQFKEKFGPEWRPRYLATPGGWALPTILMDVTRLIGQVKS